MIIITICRYTGCDFLFFPLFFAGRFTRISSSFYFCTRKALTIADGAVLIGRCKQYGLGLITKVSRKNLFLLIKLFNRLFNKTLLKLGK